MRVEEFLENSVRSHPDKVALVVGESRLSYADVDRESCRMACVLGKHGVRRGDRVVVFLDNSVEAVISLFGILKAGAVFSIVNPTTKTDKLAYILNNCGASALITRKLLLSAAAGAVAKAPSVAVTLVADAGEELAVRGGVPMGDALRNADEKAPPHGGIDNDLAMIIYTSGSTGFPKGVMMTHCNIVTAASSITTYLENTSDDIILNALPLSFDYGLYQVLMGFLVGGTVVLEQSFTYPYLVLKKLKSERATGFPLVPTMAALLLQMKDLIPGSFPSLRYISNTAAALPPAHIERLQELFPSIQIYSMYGLTECKRCTYLPPDQLRTRSASVGKAIPNTEVYILNERGERANPGEIGELVVRGGHVMKGYWEDPEATDRVLRPGPNPWEKVLHTGDFFKADEEGFLYFMGRRDDFIKTRGEKVSPKEIENHLYGLAGVREAVTVGIPDAILGMAIKAIIVPEKHCTITEKDVLRHCASGLEDFMLPKYVEFRGELPKTDSGKIMRRTLQEEALRTEAGPDPAVRDINHSSPQQNNTPVRGVEERIEKPFSAEVLRIDAALVTERIAEAIRDQVLNRLSRRGVVLGLSGGVDSSVAAALCVRALGSNRVVGLLMPEEEGDPESLRLGRLVADALGVEAIEEDISLILRAVGCYRRRDALIRQVAPEYGPGCKCKLVLTNTVGTGGYNVLSLAIQTPTGEEKRFRLSSTALLGIVAATNMKQRTRKMMEYHHADRLAYAVTGTPNRLEYDQGFFVKNGDGAADIKPIAHLYKSQVYQLAEYLDIPEEIRRRPPSTDTFPLHQTQEEFYFYLPYEKLDLCLYGLNQGIPAGMVAAALGLSTEQVDGIYLDIERKRRATRYQHEPPLLTESVVEVG